jgi:Family of unknown function (DUF6325)
MDRHQPRSGSGLPYVAGPDGRARTFAYQWRRMHSVAGSGLGKRRCHPLVGDGSSAWSGEAWGNDPDAVGRSELPVGKTMSDADVELGPVDYLVVAFPADKADFSGQMASELRALMDSNTVRLLDLLLLTKDLDGSVEGAELRDAADSVVGQLRAAEADLAVLLAESDVEEIGQVLEPGSTAAVLVWENIWAAPFGAAVRRSGGQLVTSGRVPTQAILAAIEADRAAQAEGA